MGYHDQFEDADILDTMSWMGMPEAHRIMKTAALFLRREKKIRREHRNWEGPTPCNIRPFVKSYYTPPRGRGKATIEMTLQAIEYQRNLRDKRSRNRPYKPETEAERNTEHAVEKRRNAVAARYYTIYTKDWDEKKVVADHKCVGIGDVRGILLLADKGDSYGRRQPLPRIYMQEKATGKVKVVVLEAGGNVRSISSALLRLAPKGPMRTMFGGETLTLLFDAEAFEWRGQLVPWRNVRKVYYGKGKAHKMAGRPAKPKE
jgi:hypothetical protein